MQVYAISNSEVVGFTSPLRLPFQMSRRVMFSQTRVKRISSPFVSNSFNTLYRKNSTNLFPPRPPPSQKLVSLPHAEMNFYPTLQFFINILAFLHTNPQCRKAMQPRYAITQSLQCNHQANPRRKMSTLEYNTQAQ